MPKEFKFLFKPLLLFIFLFSVLFSQDDCNNTDALNYNPDADNFVDECVYVADIPVQYIDEDTPLDLDVSQFYSGNSDYFSNIGMTADCAQFVDVDNVEDCYFYNGTILRITVPENFDSQTGVITLNIIWQPTGYSRVDTFFVIVNPINDPHEIVSQNDELEAIIGNNFELFIEVEDTILTSPFN